MGITCIWGFARARPRRNRFFWKKILIVIFLRFWNAVSPKEIVRFWWNFRRDSVRDKRWFRPSFKTNHPKTTELRCFFKKTVFMNNYRKNRPRMLCKKYIFMIFFNYYIWTISNVRIQDLERFFTFSIWSISWWIQWNPTSAHPLTMNFC